MKQNDWFALNLNIEERGIMPEANLALYGITPDNTGLQSKDYYKNIPRVLEHFKDSESGEFNEDAFNAYYDSLTRSYSDFANDSFIDNLLATVPDSPYDIFSMNSMNIADDSAKIRVTRDPNRHQVGMGNIFKRGEAVFSEREVAQANKARDAEGKELDWTPNDKGFLKGLFRPTLAMATWDENGTHVENGQVVPHFKGQHKYDPITGDPFYQELAEGEEIYGKDILHFTDTLTKEGTFLNKLDVFDSDGVKTSLSKVIGRAALEAGLYMSPAGWVLGGLAAAVALGKTLPVITKQINGAIAGNNSNALGKTMTSVENWMSRFNTSQSDYSQGKFWGYENIGNMAIDSIKQLYSQGLIQKLPKLLSKNPSIFAQKLGQTASIAYMATTSAEDVYGQYKLAGADDRTAGIASLATMAAFFSFMNNDYFKTYLFGIPGMELPELHKLVGVELKNTNAAIIDKINKNAGTIIKNEKKLLINPLSSDKWYAKVYNTTTGWINKFAPKLKEMAVQNPYLVRGANEGLEEVMEEAATDFIKGITLGAESLGMKVRANEDKDLDFGFTPEDFFSRYTASLVGGFLGGTVFEGLTQWNNRKIKSISKLPVDEQLSWYIRNGYGEEIEKIINYREKKGKNGSKALSFDYTVDESDPDNKKIVFKTGDDYNNQNKEVSDNLRQRVKLLRSELEALNILHSDNEVLTKAMDEIKSEAKKLGMDVSDYQNKYLRDARIDFIKQTGIDKLIVFDAANIRHEILSLSRRIDDRIKELSDGVQDNQKERLKAEIDADEAIKLWRSELKKAKENYDELLSGKHVNHYLSLALFRNDDDLYKMYVADIAKDEKKRYFEDIRGYVRARYNRDYDEWLRNAGEVGEDGKTELQRYLEEEFNEWLRTTDSTEKLIGAFNIHESISEKLRPIIEEQIKNYNSYKSDTERGDSINASPKGIAYINKISEDLQKANDALVKYQEEHSENLEEDEEYQKLEAEYNRAFLTYNVVTGTFWESDNADNLSAYPGAGRGLDVMFKPNAKSKTDFVNVLLDKGNKELFGFLKTYYEHLNNEKIVSDFAEDLMEIGVAQAAIRNRDISFRDLNTRRSIAVDSVYNQSEPENIEIKLNAILDTDEVLSEEEKTDLRDRFNELKEAYANSNYAYVFDFNGKNQSFIRHALSIIEDATEPIEETDSKLLDLKEELINNEASQRSREEENPLYLDKDAFTTFSAKIDNFYTQIRKTPELGIAAYNDLVNWLTEYNKTNKINGNLGIDAKAIIDSILFEDGVNIIDEIQKIKQIRANGIPTPIRDLVNALTTEFNGVKLPIWDILQQEMLGLKSQDAAEDYTIKSPTAYSELKYLMHVLQLIAANVKAAVPFGVNTYLAMLNEDHVYPILGSQLLGDVYQTDLNIVLQRVSHLLALHDQNKRSTIELKKESKIINAPKFARALIVNLPDKDKPLHENFKKYLGINISEIWDIANPDNEVDLDEDITAENFDKFWYAFRRFMDELYKATENVNWEETIKKINEARGSADIGTKNQALAFIITNSFTDLWKLETSEINNRPESDIKSSDIAKFLTSIISHNPKEIFEAIQATSEKTGRVPFWDQELAIFNSVAQGYNQELSNLVLQAIDSAKYGAVMNNSDISSDDANYLKEKPVIFNAINIDGASGTGKSSTVLRFVSECFKLLPPESESGKQIVKELVVAKYSRRMNALGTALNVTGDNRSILSDLQEKLLGRKLTEEDFDIRDGHYRTLKKTEDGNSYLITEELAKRSNIWGLNDNEVLNVYIDESGFLSEADLVFLSEASKFGKVNLFFAGDSMQKSYTLTTEDGNQVNSGIIDCMMWNTPRLTQSLRSGYYGMQENLEYFESVIGTLLSDVRETPWMHLSDLSDRRSGLASDIKLKYTETEDGVYGFHIVTDGDAAFEKLKSFGKTIGIIATDTEKYKHLSSSNVIVLTPEEAQGEEFDFVLIDVDAKSLPTQLLDFLRSAYTMISRARIGGYIVNGIGDRIKSDEVEPTASVEINERGEDDELAGDEITEYKEWFKHLYTNDIYKGVITTSAETGEGEEGGEGNGSGSRPGTSGTYKPAFLDSFSADGFDEKKEKEWKDAAAEKGSGITSPYGTRTTQKTHDLNNYKERVALLKDHEYKGDVVDPKLFIDWLITDKAKDLLTGKSSPIFNYSYNDEQYLKYLEFVRNFALDFWQEQGDALYDTVKSNGESQREVFGGNRNWSDFIDALHRQIKEDKGQRLVYAVKEGTDVYLYYRVNTGNRNAVIPVGIIPNGKFEGWYNLSVTEAVPMTMLSSDGQTTKDIDEISGNGKLAYVEISKDIYILKADEDNLNFADSEKGKECKDHVKGMRGIGQVVFSSQFGHKDSDNDNLLNPRKDTNGKIERIDQTVIDGKRRFMAVNRRITAKEYFEIAQLLHKLRHKGRKGVGSITDEEFAKLEYYWQADVLTGIDTAAEEGDKIKALKKAYLISNSSRAQLVSALMRYYLDPNRSGRNTFNDKFNSYIADTPFGYKGMTYQKGVSITRYKENGFPETFFVMFNKDSNNFDVYTWDKEERVYASIMSIGVEDWLGSAKQDPYTAAFGIFSKLAENGFISGTMSQEEVSNLLNSGDISFSLTSKRVKDGVIEFYSPFDSDIGNLVDITEITDDLDEFLRKDSVFKYGFLVSPKAQGEVNENWFYSHDRSQYQTDALEILPPVFTLGFKTADIDGLPNLGILDHKIVSDDPKDIIVERKIDEADNIIEFNFQKNYKVTTAFLEECGIDVSNITDSTVLITGIKVENGTYSVEFTNDNGGGYVREIKQSDINKILAGTKIQDISPEILFKTDTYYVEPTENGYEVKHNGMWNPGKIISFNNGELIVLAFNKFISFKNVSEDKVKKLGWEDFRDEEFTFVTAGSNDTEAAAMYYNKTKDIIRAIYFADNNEVQILDGVIANIKKIDSDTFGFDVETKEGIIDNISVSISDEKEMYDIVAEKFSKGQLTTPTSVDFSKALQTFGKKVTPEMRQDPLLKTDPNAWAKKYAVILNGLYTFMENKGIFAYPKENKRIFNFVNWIASKFGYDSEIVQEIINEMTDVSFDSDNNFISLVWQGQTFIASVEEKAAGFIFTEYNPEVETGLKKFTNFLNSIEDETLRKALLIVAKTRSNPTIDSEGAWAIIGSNPNKELIAQAIELMDNISEEEMCNIIL